MRISTSQMHERGLNAMLDQQADLSKTELQLATGRRILTPADDPTGSSRVLEVDQTKAAAEQHNRNADLAESRLELEEGVLGNTSDVLHRIRELALQANNDTQTNESRQSIAEEMRQLEEELMDLANTQDSEGAYLFAGNKGDTQAFTKDANGNVAYQGDQAQRHLQIGSSNQVAVGDPGSDIFMAVPEGNGEFVVNPDSNNTGSGVIGRTSVTDSGELTGHDYTVGFGEDSDGNLRYLVNDDTDDDTFDWDAVDWDNTGNLFEPGQSIEFDGMSFTVQGEPAAGDELTVEPAGNQSVFETVNDLINTVEGSNYTAKDAADFHNDVNRALANLDQAEGNVSNTRAKIGGRLNDIERQRYSNEDQVLHMDTLRSEIEDLDYAEATSRFAQQENALKAAQQSYIKVKDLSLFNYM